jgi:hypothetical protein
MSTVTVVAMSTVTVVAMSTVTPSTFCRKTNSSTENLGETIHLDVFLVRKTRNGNVNGASGDDDDDTMHFL